MLLQSTCIWDWSLLEHLQSEVYMEMFTNAWGGAIGAIAWVPRYFCTQIYYIIYNLFNNKQIEDSLVRKNIGLFLSHKSIAHNTGPQINEIIQLLELKCWQLNSYKTFNIYYNTIFYWIGFSKNISFLKHHVKKNRI